MGMLTGREILNLLDVDREINSTRARLLKAQEACVALTSMPQARLAFPALNDLINQLNAELSILNHRQHDEVNMPLRKDQL